MSRVRGAEQVITEMPVSERTDRIRFGDGLYVPKVRRSRQALGRS
jgi:hypothetical protein